jgi:hypothetical protein
MSKNIKKLKSDNIYKKKDKPIRTGNKQKQKEERILKKFSD